MNKTFYLMIGVSLFFSVSVKAQSWEIPELPNQEMQKSVDTKVYDVVEEMPSFPGGQGALMAFLSSKVTYPAVAQKNGIQGRVIVSFIVEKDGTLSNIKVLRSVAPSLDAEAVRVVAAMPRWKSGKQNGFPVRVKYTVPVIFRLQ